ncbi:unnamed protein product [Cuscuta epithymum]|uniref:Pectin acetylesterase n=1 Tax=Cuscuta epithymum TaxID=186058 RepID=A0AAV0DNS9_9ASTE|nr:unnamed protein product [Cuscuta epithymum]CAH9142388.1 unnamed protein product [Cuscuta epithymum]
MDFCLRMLLVITLITSMALTKDMSAERLLQAHDPLSSLANGNNNGYSQISTGPFSPRVSMEASCNINIVFNLLIDCVPFFSGTSSIPAVACCSGVEVAVKTEVDCLCDGLTDLLTHSGLVFNVSRGLDLLNACFSPISYSIISNCVSPTPPAPVHHTPVVPTPTPSPITPPPTHVGPNPTPSPIPPPPTPVCLGGNKAAYYYAPGFGKGAENWVVYLPGGGWCNNVTACEIYTDTKGVGLSPRAIPFTAILDSDKEKNPDFYDWNRVSIRYCDASSFTGNSEITTTNGTKLFFRGGRIFSAVMQELLQKGMGNAKNALLVGGSAGGVATTIYCDRFRNFFPSNSRVKCLCDGGYFFLAKNHIQGNTFLSMFEGLINLHRSEDMLPKSCTTRLSAPMCFFPPNLQEDVKTPIFFLMSAFDRVQIQYTLSMDLTGCVPMANCSANQIKASQDLRSELLTILPKRSKTFFKGFLITHPFAHTQVENGTWNSLATGTNKTIASLFGDWYFERQYVEVIDSYPCPYKCP